MFEKYLPYLKGRELPGPLYWNRLMWFLRRIMSRNPRLILNERPGGGIYIDLTDADQAASAAMDISFKGTVSSGKVTIAAGSVRLPGSTLSVSASTISSNAHIYVCIKRSEASIQTGGSFPSLVDAYNQELYVPLGIFSSGSYTHKHIGDIIIPNMPYFWINGFTANAAQSLDHDISGNMIWMTYGDCPAAEE